MRLKKMARQMSIASLPVLACTVAVLGPAASVEAQETGECPPSPVPVLTERSLGDDLGLTPGSKVIISSGDGLRCVAIVEGVFEPPADPAVLTRERSRVLLHLPDLQRLSGRADEVDRFSASLSVPGGGE